MTEAREAIEQLIAQAIDDSEIVADRRLYYGIGASKWVAARRVLTALSEAGYVVAPKEPSQPMRNAAVDAVDLGLGMSWRNRSPQMVAADIYRAMISAATPPAKGGE